MVKKFESIEEAYQNLTDMEILDDSKDYPCAKINIKGLCRVEITMVSEYQYFYILDPFRTNILTYYANMWALEKKETDKKKIVDFIQSIGDEMETTKKGENVKDKADRISFMFKDATLRKSVFVCLRRLGVIPWWVSWRRYQMKATPDVLPMMFVWLWLFNFDGLKKKARLLFQKITRVMDSHLPTDLNTFTDLGSWFARVKKASLKQRGLSEPSNN